MVFIELKIGSCFIDSKDLFFIRLSAAKIIVSKEFVLFFWRVDTISWAKEWRVRTLFLVNIFLYIFPFSIKSNLARLLNDNIMKSLLDR